MSEMKHGPAITELRGRVNGLTTKITECIKICNHVSKEFVKIITVCRLLIAKGIITEEEIRREMTKNKSILND